MQKTKRSKILVSLLTGSIIFSGLMVTPSDAYAQLMN